MGEGSSGGHCGVTSVPGLAAGVEVTGRVRDRLDHAAVPRECADAIITTCQLVQALQRAISRNLPPVEAGGLSVTQIHAGDAMNVIPDEAVIKGTVRTFSEESLDLIEHRMAEIVDRLPQTFGCTATMAFKRNYPVLINHAAETEFAQSVIKDMVGVDNLQGFTPTMGAEDFAFMLAAKPGCYVMIGNGDGAHRAAGHGLGPCVLHNPNYDFNDELIPIGASYWVHLAHRWLAQPAANTFKQVTQ